MSYCRFSSANWKSDVYIYDGSEGITIHVASFRYKGYISKIPNILDTEPKAWREAYKKHHRCLAKCRQVNIDHELAGSTTYHRTVKEAVAELRFLQYEGFFVPEFVFDELDEEEI